MVGYKIKELRKAAGYTQVQFAKKVGIGVATLRRIEKPTDAGTNPRMHTLESIAKGFGMTLRELLNYRSKIESARESRTHSDPAELRQP